MSRPFLRKLIALALALGSSVPALAADGNELYAIGAVQKSLGGAGAASPRDATWVLLNPASIVDITPRLDLLFEFLYIKAESEPRGFPLVANPFAGSMTDARIIPFPSASTVWRTEKGTLGFGIFGVQGDRVNFPHPRTTVSLLQNADRRAGYEVARVPLSYAREFSNGWAVGASIIPTFARLRTDSVTLRLAPTRGRNHWSEAAGIGFQLGLYRRWEHWGLGAAYTSRTWMSEHRNYRDDLITWNFDLPQKIQAGLLWQPTPRLGFVLDFKHVFWTDVEILRRKTVQGGLGWNNQSIVKGGVSWDVNDRLSLRTGVSWSEAPFPDSSVFVNALSPAISQTHLAAGFSYKLNKHATAHFSFTHALPESRTESGKGDLFSFFSKGTKIGYSEDSATFQLSLFF